MSLHNGRHTKYNEAFGNALDRVHAKHSGLSGQAYRDAVEKEVFKLQNAARGAMSAGLPLYGDEVLGIWNTVLSTVV